MAIYIKLGDIKGDVTQGSHKEWLDAQSLQWGVGRAISTPVGSAANREASEPSVSEVVFTKQLDSSFPKLFEEATVGKKAGMKVNIHLTTTSDKGDQNFVEYELEGAMISGYSQSTGGDRPSESISLNFTKIVVNFIPLKADGKPGTPIKAGYDLAAAAKV